MPQSADEPQPQRGPTLHAEDLALAQTAAARQRGGLDRFIVRMQCVPKFLAQQNARSGHQLTREAVEDLVQDVLSAVWRRLPNYRGEASLETWVFRFCELQMRNALRRAAPRRTVPLSQVDEATDATAEGHPAFDDRDVICDALDRLAAEDAAVLRLKHFEDLTFDEIGQRLAASPNTIKTRYYRALQTLRRQLDTNPAREGPS